VREREKHEEKRKRIKKLTRIKTFSLSLSLSLSQTHAHSHILAVQLPNDGSSNGYNRSETCLEYFPNIAYSSLKYVKDISPYCSYVKFTSEVDLVNQQIDNMLEDQSFETQVRANVSCLFSFHLISNLLIGNFSILWMFTTVH